MVLRKRSVALSPFWAIAGAEDIPVPRKGRCFGLQLTRKVGTSRPSPQGFVVGRRGQGSNSAYGADHVFFLPALDDSLRGIAARTRASPARTQEKPRPEWHQREFSGLVHDHLKTDPASW